MHILKMTHISTCSVNYDFISYDRHSKMLEYKGVITLFFNSSCSDDKTYGDFPGHEIYKLTCKLKDAHHGMGLVHST